MRQITEGTGEAPPKEEVTRACRGVCKCWRLHRERHDTSVTAVKRLAWDSCHMPGRELESPCECPQLSSGEASRRGSQASGPAVDAASAALGPWSEKG